MTLPTFSGTSTIWFASFCCSLFFWLGVGSEPQTRRCNMSSKSHSQRSWRLWPRKRSSPWCASLDKLISSFAQILKKGGIKIRVANSSLDDSRILQAWVVHAQSSRTVSTYYVLEIDSPNSIAMDGDPVVAVRTWVLDQEMFQGHFRSSMDRK